MATDGYKQFAVELTGIVPMLMHNGQLSDPKNEFARKMKDLSGKRKKTDADYEALGRLEFMGGLYLNSAGEICPPTLVIESLIVEGARTHREGQIALAGAFVDPGVKFEFDGPKTPEERAEDPTCRLEVGVRVQRNRVQRTRPIFENWTLRFGVSALEEEVTRDHLSRWLRAAGTKKGLGDWRPRYGRFELSSLVSGDLEDRRKKSVAAQGIS